MLYVVIFFSSLSKLFLFAKLPLLLPSHTSIKGWNTVSHTQCEYLILSWALRMQHLVCKVQLFLTTSSSAFHHFLYITLHNFKNRTFLEFSCVFLSDHCRFIMWHCRNKMTSFIDSSVNTHVKLWMLPIVFSRSNPSSAFSKLFENICSISSRYSVLTRM